MFFSFQKVHNITTKCHDCHYLILSVSSKNQERANQCSAGMRCFTAWSNQRLGRKYGGLLDKYSLVGQYRHFMNYHHAPSFLFMKYLEFSIKIPPTLTFASNLDNFRFVQSIDKGTVNGNRFYSLHNHKVLAFED